MSTTDDIYELALSKALHDRGMSSWEYTRNIELENLALRKLLKKCETYLPMPLQREIELHTHNDAYEP